MRKCRDVRDAQCPPRGHWSPFPADTVPESSSRQFGIVGGSTSSPPASTQEKVPAHSTLLVLC